MSGRGRGRRPAAVVAAAQNADNTNEAQKKVTKKKKQFPVVAVITPDGIEGNLQPESKRPLIVHLPIQSKDINFNDMPINYDPEPPCIPEPYDINENNPFYDISEQLVNNTESEKNKDEKKQSESIAAPVVNNNNAVASSSASASSTQIDYYNLKGTMLVQFKNSTEIKTIPESSESACFWCCHTFTNRPVILPIRDHGEYLTVHGNFCCPECAMAHLFDIKQDSHTRWEQLALLYRIYGESCGGKINPAPPRHILKHFGGVLSIEEYREMIRSYTVRVDIHLPPMVSLLSTMDTKPIDFYDTALTKNVNETVKERLQKAEEVLRLRRTKPLKAWESTLDACMNLRIRQEDKH